MCSVRLAEHVQVELKEVYRARVCGGRGSRSFGSASGRTTRELRGRHHNPLVGGVWQMPDVNSSRTYRSSEFARQQRRPCHAKYYTRITRIIQVKPETCGEDLRTFPDGLPRNAQSKTVACWSNKTGPAARAPPCEVRGRGGRGGLFRAGLQPLPAP